MYNLSGGIKAWQGGKAVGPQDLGMHLFTGREAPQKVLQTAYSLEQGLRDFYLDMEKESRTPEVKSLFSKLAEIEVKHQEEILNAYNRLGKEQTDRAGLEKRAEIQAMEGGLTTREYLDRFQPDFNSPKDVVSLAMSIEAQALDLYQRVGPRLESEEAKAVIGKIANDEKTHLASLGTLMESL